MLVSLKPGDMKPILMVIFSKWPMADMECGLNLSGTDSKVVYLPPNVTEYYNAYTWNSGNIRNGIM